MTTSKSFKTVDNKIYIMKLHRKCKRSLYKRIDSLSSDMILKTKDHRHHKMDKSGRKYRNIKQ